MTDCDLRLLTTVPEMEAAVALQRRYWGDNPEYLVPAHMLHTLAQHGGHVLAAVQRDNDLPVAILVGLPGIPSMAGADGVRPWLVSKRLVVHEDWRRRGLALRLKLEQRERALAQGIDLVRWTCDPLLAANARLNLHRLGAVATGFSEDFFGTAGAGGEANLGSPDRLLVDWQLEQGHARTLTAGATGQSTLATALAQGATWLYGTQRDARGLPVPTEMTSFPESGRLLLEIPADIIELARRDAGLAQVWREHMRTVLRALFAAGHVLQDCVRACLDDHERICYLSAATGSEA